MRILEVNKFYHPWVGGVETAARDIAEGLNGQGGFEFKILVCQPKGFSKKEIINGIPVFKSSSLGIFKGSPLSLSFFFNFYKLAKKSDLIFLHHPFPAGFLAYYLFSRKKKLVVWYHSDIVRQRILGTMLLPLTKWVLERAKLIFVSSHNLVENSKVLRKFSNKCKIIPFGIDLENFKITKELKEGAEIIREKVGSPLVLSVGRLVYYKGFEYLIRAMEWVNGKLIIVGKGPLKRELDDLIRALGIGDKIRFVNFASDIKPYILACDVFVLPSVERSETFGMVQLEALACGKPVVNTNLETGVPGVIEHEKSGLTVRKKDAYELSDAINKIISDKSLQAKMSKEAKERAKMFSKELFLEKISKELGNLS